MKRVITILIVALVLGGCTEKKSDESTSGPVGAIARRLCLVSMEGGYNCRQEGHSLDYCKEVWTEALYGPWQMASHDSVEAFQ